MVRMTGGHAVIKQLISEGVDTVFAVPGHQVMHIYDGFRDSPEIQVVTCRHEQTAVFAADGYARTTGKIGVAIVVPGPGAYNAGAAMATAFASSSPVLLISGQMSTDEIRLKHGALHEINDQMEFMKPVTKWLKRVSSAIEIPSVLHQAFEQLRTGRPQPVEVEIPQDHLEEAHNFNIFDPESYNPTGANPVLIDRATSLLAEAKKPIIVAGDGVIRSEACDDLERLATLLSCPVLFSTDARGALPDSHPLAFTSPHTPYADNHTLPLLSTADAVLVVGGRINGSAVNRMNLKTDQQWIHIDIDPSRLKTAYASTIAIEADARLAISMLAKGLEARNLSPQWEPKLLADFHIKRHNILLKTFPRQMSVMDEIKTSIPSNAIFVIGVTVGSRWFVAGVGAEKPGTLLTSSYMTTLGFAFPLGLGVKRANPNIPVISLSGDGGLMYAIGDLATAVQYEINLVTLVFNNGKFGASQHDQVEGRFKNRITGTDLQNPDLVKLAESFGAVGFRVENLRQLPKTIQRALNTNRPVIVDVCGDAMNDLDILFK